MTDPLGRGFAYQYDAHGRLLQETLPGARPVSYGYDAAGNLTSLTPPERPAHRFEYDGLGQLTAYIPPALADVTNPRTSYEYNKAQQLTKLTRPDNLAITYGYDPAGRLQSTQFSRGAVSYSYNPTTGQLTTISAPENVTLGFQYKGDLLTGESWSGALTGNVQRAYNAGYRTASISVNNTPINYQYDADNAPSAPAPSPWPTSRPAVCWRTPRWAASTTALATMPLANCRAIAPTLARRRSSKPAMPVTTWGASPR